MDIADEAEVTLPEFARAFSLRAPRLHLLVGAGASISSGIPSAASLVWEFKKAIFATETHTHPSRIGNLLDPIVRDSIQRFFDSNAGYPPRGAEAEYSFYFERAYKDPQDRRLLINQKVQSRTPAYGYLCLGVLLHQEKIRTIWTTNFDDLIEKAYSIVSAGELASVVGRDTTSRLETLLSDGRFPIIVKLHGDFRYDPLQNTTEETASCDASLRSGLEEQSRDYGLVVVGYSGRDQSVMSALNGALDSHGARAFPHGLYWCAKEGHVVSQPVTDLLARARKNGIRASIVPIADFDDFVASLYKAGGVQNSLVDASLADRGRPRTGYTLTRFGRTSPILKFNAIPITSYPDTCYRFKSTIDEWAKLRQVTRDKRVVAALVRKQFIHALGRRTDIQECFGPFGIDELQPVSIGVEDLRVERSYTLGMFYDLIVRSLVGSASALRTPPTEKMSRLVFIGRDYVPEADLVKSFRAADPKANGQLVRKNTGHNCWIHEAVELSLDFREDQLWLLFQPTVYLSGDGVATPWEAAGKKDIIRELVATRYNKQISDLFTFWLRLLLSCAPDGKLPFLGSEEPGIQVTFGHSLALSYRHS